MTNMASHGFIYGFGLSASLIMAIGAQNLFVLQQALRRSYIGTMVLFCGSVDAVLVAMGVMGLGAMLTSVAHLATVMTIGGAALLTYYGLQAFWRSLRPEGVAQKRSQTLSLQQTMLTLGGLTFLNPHVYLDTVVLMGVSGSALPNMEKLPFVIGAACASFVWFSALGYGASRMSGFLSRPSTWRAIDTLVGCAMIAMAIRLVCKMV